MGTDRKPFHVIVAEKLIQQLKEGTAPWQRPWEAGAADAVLPFNPVTGKRYKGVNALHLMSEGRDDQRWMTYKQAQALDAQVRKGEQGTQVQYWKFSEEQTVVDAAGNPRQVDVALERPRVFFATVFNATQIDGLSPLQPRKEHEWDAHERAEAILHASGAVIHRGEGDRAFYHPDSDSIYLPDRRLFASADNFYAVALHELGHWTGHESRLDRDLAHPFGSEGYAREELRAEIASMIIGVELDIGHDPDQHAAYVQSWITALQNDPFEIFRAAADAEKIQEYIMGAELKQEQEQAVTQTPMERQVAAMQPVLEVNLLGEGDQRVVVARRDTFMLQQEGRDFTDAAERFDAVSEDELGFSIPLDWTGHVRVYGFGTESVNDQNGLTTFLPKDVEPEAWGIFAQHRNGDYSMLRSLATRSQADDLAQRLTVIDAYSTVDEGQKAVKLARINEENVRRDLNSTDEDIAAAIATRKNAEFVATVGDADLKQRIEAEERVRSESAPEMTAKVFLDVPFKQKEKVKALGAKWDRQEQSWYISASADQAPFAQWLRGGGGDVSSSVGPIQVKCEVKTYLAVPYNDRQAAKAAGAAWDKEAKSWYVGQNADLAKLEHWKVENASSLQFPAMTAREEFADALKSVGCVLSGDHPIMDGETHRIAVEGEKFSRNSGAGFYVGHLDGHPAGYVKNNKTGAELKWKSKGYSLDSVEKAKMAEVVTEKLRKRDEELLKRHEQAARRVRHQMESLVPVQDPTAYMLTKGIKPQEGALTDAFGKKTYLPAFDADGIQWSMQYIQEDGTKRFAAESRKDGCFHAVGGMGNLAKAPAIVVCEGYATAVSLAQCLGHATVSAFDSGNLPPVAKALHEKFPGVPMVIAADDDRHLEATQGVNPGRTKAFEAAVLVGAKVILPIFARGENSFPDGMDPVTPDKYREYLASGNGLDKHQLAVLAAMKQHTDFNDLATSSMFSRDGLWRQVGLMVHSTIERHRAEKIDDQRAMGIAEQEVRTKRKVSMKLS